VSNFARIQNHIDKGKGKAARHVGMPFLGYRLTSASTGDFPTAWTPIPVCPAGTHYEFSMLRRRLAEGKLELGIKNVALFYDIVANMNPFLVGDVFVQNDAAFVPGKSYGAGATAVVGATIEFNGVALAWHPPENKAVGARIDRRATIWRPSQQPATVTTATGAKYWKETNVNDVPLVLSGGVYRWGVAGAGWASLVPIGMMAAIRQSDWIMQPGIPGMLKEAKWFGYLPPLPGYLPAEGDAIIDENGARYHVVVPFEQKTGVAGYQLVLDRKIASDGETNPSLDFSDPNNSMYLPGGTP
jgi:hypothetical protein